jgi:cell growth-regulating nucleolar protein
MVSFSCNVCNDVVTKGKVANHARSCRSYSFSCVDCMEVFDLETIKPHVSCISEVAKYQGKYAALPNGNPVKRSRAADSSDDEQPAPQKPRPKRVVPTFSDSDDDDGSWVKTRKMTTTSSAAAQAATAAGKKHHASPKASPLSSPAVAPSHHTPIVVISKVDKSGEVVHENVRIDAFVLGTADVVAEISSNILEESGVHAMPVKDLSKKVVERFQARLAKQLKDAIEHSIGVAGFRHGVRQVGSNIEKH